EQFSSLGLKVQVTELDVSVYPWEKNQRPLREGEKFDLTPDQEQKQMQVYKNVFQIFRDYKSVITGITFWNISDQHTWLDEYPVKGRKNYPLLFDQNLQRKKAYWEVVNFKK
ncbi:MAG: xynB 2, partial [Daejeonella sp.]|nr:xynB 2 [Daejeonella sp.]